MAIVLKKINNHVVKPIPNLIGKPKDTRPAKGGEVIAELFAIVAMVGKKESAKTSTMFHILESCVGKDTKVYIFGHTVSQDDNWKNVKKWLEDNEIDYEAFTKIEGNLEPIVAALDEKAKEEELAEKLELDQPKKKRSLIFDDTEFEPKIKKKKPKFATPEVFFLFDDINDELRTIPALNTVVTENRHWHSKMLFSTHSIMNLMPTSRKMINVFIMYKGQDDKLEQIYKDADVGIPFDLFAKLYKDATSRVKAKYMKNGLEKTIYHFFYVDAANDDFRVSFGEKYDLKNVLKE